MHTSEQFILPFGPQHPALKEPGHFEFTVDGERITAATVRLGYVHRGIEKAAETRNWTQNLYLLERVCGICSHTHATAYVLAVEQLAGVEAPPCAQAMRTLLAELERIHSHLLWLGVAAHEAGLEALFMYAWRDRETVMDLLEQISGNRINYSANVLGGVKFDLAPAHPDVILRGLDYLEGRVEHYRDVVTHDEGFLRRTRGLGITPTAQAETWGLVGPTARASGVRRDIRIEAPYLAYVEQPVHWVTDSAGDLAARFVVRLNDLLETNRLIRALLAHWPTGDLTTRMPRKIKAGEAISRIEAPRGELFYFVKSNGSDMPERIHIRTPTLTNLGSVLTLTLGQKLADVPMILTGVDPCFSCNDRLVIIHRDDAPTERWTWEQLQASATSNHSAP